LSCEARGVFSLVFLREIFKNLAIFIKNNSLLPRASAPASYFYSQNKNKNKGGTLSQGRPRFFFN